MACCVSLMTKKRLLAYGQEARIELRCYGRLGRCAIQAVPGEKPGFSCKPGFWFCASLHTGKPVAGAISITLFGFMRNLAKL